MSLEPHQIAKAFCSHKFAETFPYMDDDIKWHVIGRAELIGREAVIAQIGLSRKFLETVSTTSLKLETICAENNIVLMKGSAEFRDGQNQTLAVASADIFHFSDGLLVEINSYVIDLDKPS